MLPKFRRHGQDVPADRPDRRSESGSGFQRMEKMEKMEIDHPVKKHKSTENLPWVEKYRPNFLSDLISNEQVISTINRLITKNRMPNLLLYGSPGTGKTSTILAIARQINGKNYMSMTLELNASDERGINVVREKIKEFASTQQIFQTGLKIVILDEADAMTHDAQFALRRVIERFCNTTRFCLICNYVNKIIPALQSRCTRFRFAPLKAEQTKNRIKYISTQEGINITNDGIDAIIQLSGGDMRKIINILQSTYLAHNNVTSDTVHLCTGAPSPHEIEQIIDLLMNPVISFDEIYKGIFNIKSARGLALVDTIRCVHDHVLKKNLPSPVYLFLLPQLAQIEHNLSFSTNENIQLAGLVGAFQLSRKIMQNISEGKKNPMIDINSF